MVQKHYPKSLRDEAVLFYERGHTFAETKAKYGMSQSTFYEWKKQFDRAHPVPEASGTDLSAARKAQRHLEKLSLELEVLRQCPCGIYGINAWSKTVLTAWIVETRLLDQRND